MFTQTDFIEEAVISEKEKQEKQKQAEDLEKERLAANFPLSPLPDISNETERGTKWRTVLFFNPSISCIAREKPAWTIEYSISCIATTSYKSILARRPRHDSSCRRYR